MATKRTDALAEAALATFVEGMPDALAELTAEVRAARPDPLDLSYASIDRAEAYYVQVLAERPRRAPGVADRLARYMGATLIEHAGGRTLGVPAARTGRAAPGDGGPDRGPAEPPTDEEERALAL